MYEIDDGKLTEEQLEKIRELSEASEMPDELFTQRLL